MRSKRERKREREKAHKRLSDIKKVNANTRAPNQEAVPSDGSRCRRTLRSQEVDGSVARMDPQLIADYIGQRIRLFETELSTVELEDRLIPARAFFDTTSFVWARKLDNLPKFLEAFHRSLYPEKILSQACEVPGSPHTLIVTAAALRAADVARAVRNFHAKDSIVAKLFAKHIKFKVSMDMCNKFRIGIGVGTPGRILDLIRAGALKVETLATVVLDMSATNEKKQNLFDIRETQKSVLDLLNEPLIRSRLGEHIRLLVY